MFWQPEKREGELGRERDSHRGRAACVCVRAGVGRARVYRPRRPSMRDGEEGARLRNRRGNKCPAPFVAPRLPSLTTHSLGEVESLFLPCTPGKWSLFSRVCLSRTSPDRVAMTASVEDRSSARPDGAPSRTEEAREEAGGGRGGSWPVEQSDMVRALLPPPRAGNEKGKMRRAVASTREVHLLALTSPFSRGGAQRLGPLSSRGSARSLMDPAVSGRLDAANVSRRGPGERGPTSPAFNLATLLILTLSLSHHRRPPWTPWKPHWPLTWTSHWPPWTSGWRRKGRRPATAQQPTSPMLQPAPP